MATFADRLKALRNMHHLTQDELSKITGVSRSAIGMYESGKENQIITRLKYLLISSM